MDNTTDVLGVVDESSSSSDPGAGSVDMATIAFLCVPIFLIWNCAPWVSYVALEIEYLLKGKCNSSTLILLCPHWILGIIIPGWVGYSWKGTHGSLLLLLVCVVLPYVVHYCYTNKNARIIREELEGEGPSISIEDDYYNGQADLLETPTTTAGRQDYSDYGSLPSTKSTETPPSWRKKRGPFSGFRKK